MNRSATNVSHSVDSLYCINNYGLSYFCKGNGLSEDCLKIILQKDLDAFKTFQMYVAKTRKRKLPSNQKLVQIRVFLQITITMVGCNYKLPER